MYRKLCELTYSPKYEFLSQKKLNTEFTMKMMMQNIGFFFDS